MQRSTVETRGLQPEDLGVLAALLLRDPEQPGTAKAIASDLREERGWKMSLDRFEKVFERLNKAGHAHRQSVFNPRTKRPEWVLRVYRNPANNAAYVARGAEEAAQVSGGIGENPIPGQPSVSETGENPISPGQGRNRGKPDSGAESGKTRFRDHDVSAGQNRNRGKPDSGSTPPTPPPGGGGTSSPYPLTAGAVSGGRETAEGEVRAAHLDDPALLAAAVDFLEELPTPWRAGRRTAREVAPLLLAAAADQGWELGPELVHQLTQNPGGIRSYPATLKKRIEDLPRATKSRRTKGAAAVDADCCPYHPSRERTSCPCQLADQDPPQPPLPGDALDDAAVRAAAERALASLRGQAVGAGQTKTDRRKSRTRAGREEAARLAEAAARDAANTLLNSDDMDSGEAR